MRHMKTNRFGILLVILVGAVFVASATCCAQCLETGVLGEGRPWETPWYINDSGVDGPTVVITGGIHGNEPAGARAAEQIRHWPIVRGKLIVVPRVNTAGLAENIRFIPKAPEDQRDLNRNFPNPGIADEPRGEIAKELWRFIVEQNPDWLFDLHEGYEFNISHKPKPGKVKSVGSTIIYDRSQQLSPLVERMLAAVNRTVERPERKFVLRGGGPKKSTLASAVIHVLKKRAMILETTYQYQRLSFRTRQHRVMMNVALTQLGMITADCVNILTPPADKRQGHIYVALYDDEGASERGVTNLTKVFDAAPDITVAHLGAADIRPEVLSQFDVVVFGGGSGSKQAAAIGKDGAHAVRQFVREGGGYVGICGGAYLCSAHYSWSLNLIDTHVFTGKREVAGIGLKSMWYRGKPSSQKMQLTDQGRRLFADIDETVDVRYHNGPIVSPKNLPGLKPYTVLAYFRSEQVLYPPQKGTMINTPAIVIGEFGRGRVISISPHPEATDGLQSMITSAVRAVAKSPDFRPSCRGQASSMRGPPSRTESEKKTGFPCVHSASSALVRSAMRQNAVAPIRTDGIGVPAFRQGVQPESRFRSRRNRQSSSAFCSGKTLRSEWFVWGSAFVGGKPSVFRPCRAKRAGDRRPSNREGPAGCLCV